MDSGAARDSDARRNRAGTADSETARLLLKPEAPFRLDLTVWCLRRRPHNIVDRWDGGTYRRVLAIDGAPVEIAVKQTAPPLRPAIEAAISGRRPPAAVKPVIAATLSRILGIHCDLSDFYRIARRDPHLGPIARRFEGLKPPQYPSAFEALANAIACQQVSLTAGLHVLNRLAEALGAAHQGVCGAVYAFPEPRDVLRTNLNELRGLGFSRQKARALLELAEACSDDRDVLAGIEALDNDAATARLCALRGVGRWTAGYTLLRGLGRLDSFPSGDVGAQNALVKWLRLRGKLDDKKLRRCLSRWSPYRGLIYFHLLMKGLDEQGILALPNR